jgi:caa(3)-type oxidase subunit IV
MKTMAEPRTLAHHSWLASLGLVLLAIAALVLLRLVQPSSLGPTLGLGIAAVKTTLVLAAFMHLFHQPVAARIAVLAGLLFLVSLVALTAARRATHPTASRIAPADSRPPPARD